MYKIHHEETININETENEDTLVESKEAGEEKCAGVKTKRADGNKESDRRNKEGNTEAGKTDAPICHSQTYRRGLGPLKKIILK